MLSNTPLLTHWANSTDVDRVKRVSRSQRSQGTSLHWLRGEIWHLATREGQPTWHSGLLIRNISALAWRLSKQTVRTTKYWLISSLGHKSRVIVHKGSSVGEGEAGKGRGRGMRLNKHISWFHVLAPLLTVVFFLRELLGKSRSYFLLIIGWTKSTYQDEKKGEWGGWGRGEVE